jgi:hypothetical protein
LGRACIRNRRITRAARSSWFSRVGLAEALLLGIAYRLAGVPHPALLGLATGILSVVPFASPLVFIGAALWLLGESTRRTGHNLIRRLIERKL